MTVVSQVLKRNSADQTIYFMAFDSSNNPVTGDASNITCYWSKDGGTLTVTTNDPTELGLGTYIITLTNAETAANNGFLYPVSSTSGVRCTKVTVSFLLSAFAWKRTS